MAQEVKNTDSIPKLTIKDIQQFVIERFKENKKINDLIKFHSINKYLIMAHSSSQLNKLGNIVANHNRLEISDILEKYNTELRKTFSVSPTMKSHFNTLQHILGHFSPDLSKAEKRCFLHILQNFREGKVELSEVLQILKDCTSKYEKSYLSRQTYFLFFTMPDKFNDN